MGPQPIYWNIDGWIWSQLWGVSKALKKHPVGGRAICVAPGEKGLRHTHKGNSEISHRQRFCFKNTKSVLVEEVSAIIFPYVGATSKWPIFHLYQSKRSHDITGAGDKHYLKRWEEINLKIKTAYVLCYCSRLTPIGTWNSLKYSPTQWHLTVFILDTKNKAYKNNCF